MSSLFARFGNLETKAASSENVIISLDNLQKTYLLGVEGVPALRGVSLDIKRGEFVIIYGTSGGGKTSLLNIIGTIDKPTKGHLTICGTRITSKTSDSELALIRLKKMGFVFQTFNLLSTLTALENVEMPMVLEGSLSGTERTNRATDLLERVSMGKRLDHLPSMLSGGEQQRVTIARAIANSPEILLLDEPTGDLDTTNTAIVMDMLATLNRDDNITMVMVTHDPALKNFAHRVIYMRDGKIQRIEVIDEKERALAIQDMKARSGTQSTSNTTKEIVRTLTEVKRPKDYITANDDSEKLAYGLVTELLQIEGNTSIDINSTSSDLVNTNNTIPQNRIALEKELQDINQGAEFSLFTSNTYSSSRTSSNASDYKVDV